MNDENQTANTEKNKDFERGFAQGYFCAIACVVMQNGIINTDAYEAIRANFSTIEELRELGVEEGDIEAITPAIDEIIKKRDEIRNK